MGVWISLTLYFLLMLAIGFYAWRKATSSTEGYLLGGRDLGPAVTALSAGASDMSGWLLLGLPGALFAAGLGQAWIGIGLFCGALVNWIVVAPRLRSETERYDNSLTIPEFLSKRFPSKALTLRVVSAVIVVVFFSIYTASGLVAGGKLFTSSFENLIQIGSLTDYHVGIILTLGIVLIYTAFGGFLAVSLTLGCVGLLSGREIMILLNTPDNILPQATEYLNIYFLGLPFLFMYNVLASMFNALGRSRIPLYLLIFSSVFNIVLDLILVCQFHMGVAGVAWATLIAQGISAVLAFFLFLKEMRN